MTTGLPAVQVGDRSGGVDPEGASHIEEFGDVESALAALELRHEGLWPAEPMQLVASKRSVR